MADSGEYDQATLTRRQKIAEQMWNEAGKRPVRHWAEGLANLGDSAVAGLMLGRADREAKATRESDKNALLSVLGGGAVGGAPGAMPAPAGGTPAVAAAMSSGQPRIYEQNERNPLDPPLPQDRDLMIRTIYAEAGNQGPEGQRAVASVIRNRAVNGGFGGDTVPGVIRAPNQFEPVNSLDGQQRMAALPVGSKQYDAIGKTVDEAYGGNDPTNGATHFFAPKAQAALGRPVPAWGNGPGQDIGDHRFFGSPQTAQSDPAALPPNATMTQGGSMPVAQAVAPQGAPQAAPPQAPDNKAQIAKLLSTTPGSPAHQIGLQLLTQTMKPHDFTHQTLPDGTVLQIDPTGKQPPKPVYQASSKPTFGVIGKDSNGNDVHGFIDTLKQTTTPATGVTSPSAANSSLTGDDFLKTLDPGRANQIRAIADGRMSPPGGMSLKSPQIQGLMRDVAQYEPGFDLTSWTARNKTRADMSSGKMGQNVSSFNTAIGHLETLDKSAEALKNSWSPTYNTVANWITNQRGDPRIKEFEVARTAVADELTRAFRGSGGNVHDLVQWESAINSAGSPAQLKAAIKQGVELLRSRIEAVGDQYGRGMGKTTDALTLLSPKAQEAIKKLSGEKSAPGGNKTASGITWSVE